MAISDENKKKLQWLWKDENKIQWIETFIKIADKQGNIVPFILTPEQKAFVSEIEHENIVLKSRQLGLSVCCVALSIRACVINGNTNCLLVSHNQSSTNAIFDKLKQQFFSLPKWLQPELVQNNRQALTFANGSSIVCLTAGNKDVGRGSTYNGIVHLSEFAFWKDPERQLKSLIQACSESSQLVIESTANGFNKFSEMYYQSKNKENSFRCCFFNWINGRTLFQGQYDLAVQKYLAQNQNIMLAADKYTAEEKELAKIGATAEQIIWRRMKIATEGEDTFCVEYPSTDVECFLTTGRNIFNTGKINRQLSLLKEQTIDIKKIRDLPKQLRQWVNSGSLKIYQIPKIGRRYWAGIDVSEGVGQDSSTLLLFDKDGFECCSFRNNKIKPYEYAEVCYLLGKWYNKAHLVVEKASGGHAVLERLRYDYQYRNLAKYKTYDEFNKVQWKWGFDTNAKTKSIAVNDAVEWFDKGLIHLKTKETLNEMKVFVMSDSGKMGAVTGAHDDMVSALWLAIQGLKSPYWYL